jgi:hypothetical protein
MEVVADLDYPCVIVSGCLIYIYIYKSLEVHITIKHKLKENVLNKWHGSMYSCYKSQ